VLFAGFVRCRRVTGLLLSIAASLVPSGCWVESINPLYEEGTLERPREDADLAFDQKLTGIWRASDEKCTTILSITAQDQIYDMQSSEQGDECSEDKTHRQARLVKLAQHRFLDVSPTDDAVCDMCVAKHDIFLLKFDEYSLALTPMDSDWMQKAIAAKRVRLGTLPHDSDTLTASSSELKAFCRKYADNEAVFKPDSAETFERDLASGVTGPSQPLEAKSQ
jgi:hypothetical protein